MHLPRDSKKDNRKNFLLVEHGGSRKQFTLDVLLEHNLNIYIATSSIPEWLTSFVPAENIIETDTYNSVRLLSDVVAYFESREIILDAIGTFFEHTVTQTADVANALGLKGISPLAARKSSSNKLLMRIACRDAHIPTPIFVVLPSLSKEGLARAITKVGLPCVVKPVFGSESYGTVKIDQEYDLDAIIEEISTNTQEGKKEVFKNFSGTFLVEEYLPGPVISVDGIVQDDIVHIAGIVEFIMGPEPRFTQEANYIPARLDTETSNQARAMATRIVQTLGFNNCGFHCEIRLTPKGPVLLEIAARLPGGPLQPGHLRASGINLTKALLDIWLGKKVTLDNTKRQFVLQKAVFPRTTGIITRIAISPQIRNNAALWDFTLIVKEGEKVVTYPNIPKPFYYYAVVAESKEQLMMLSKKIESEILISVTS